MTGEKCACEILAVLRFQDAHTSSDLLRVCIFCSRPISVPAFSKPHDSHAMLSSPVSAFHESRRLALMLAAEIRLQNLEIQCRAGGQIRLISIDGY